MRIGLLGAMFLLFLTLKLIGIIEWSWIVVTSPLWLPLLVVLIVFMVILKIRSR